MYAGFRTTHPASKENLPRAFHQYPMRQAIDEGFILDVLRGYIPYKVAFNLAKQEEDTKRVSGKQAKRALAQWMTLHPTNVTQKVQFIIEHFSKNIAHRLDGKAKAMVVTSSRAAVIRYKKGFDKYIAEHPEHVGIKSLVAFSGKLTGKQIKHTDDELLALDIFEVDDDAEFTEITMNPSIAGQDLKTAFERPEYRVMLVADKFQTGFDQPKLVAMYIDKKIANDVEIVQTFSRLNRTAPGKDEVFIIDFANKPENVRKAFAAYDACASITEVQDLNIVYEIKDQMDEHGFYTPEDLEQFKAARYQTYRDLTQAKEPQHKALYAATDGPTHRFNRNLRVLRDEVDAWEDAYEAAHRNGDEAGAKAADHHRKDYTEQISKLMIFKSALGRFGRTYSYIAQLINLGDPDLENFATFSKLLLKRLNGESPKNVDLYGLVLTGYDIKHRSDVSPEEAEKPAVLKPIGPGGETTGTDDVGYLHEIIDRLNHLFGEATPLRDQAVFVNHIVTITKENNVVMAQVENNPREGALKGNLPGAVQQAVMTAITSHEKLASLVLGIDGQALTALTDVVYELLRDRRIIDLDTLAA